MSYSAETLKDHVTLQRGKTYKSARLGEPGPVLLGLASIARDGGFRDDNLKTYGGDSPENLLLKPGDIYVSLKDVTQSGDLLGSVARLPATICSGRLTQDTVKLTLKSSIRPSFIYWLLRTPQYRDFCRSHATGTTNLGLAREDFLSFDVPPLTNEREQLVILLDSLDDKIELNERMNRTLEEMARALFKSWFVDFDPVHANVASSSTLPPDLATLFPAKFEPSGLGAIPKGWEVKPISDLCAVNDWTLSKKDRVAELEYIEISAVSQGNVNSIGLYCREEAPSRARRRLRHGDTVLSTVRPDRGAYFLSLHPPEHRVASTGFAVFTPTVAPWGYVYAGLTQPGVFERLGQIADGGAYPAVKPEQIAAIRVVVPSDIGVLQAFQQCVEPILSLANDNRRQSRTLAALRDSLLPKLLSGELSVAEAEEAVA